MRDGTVSFFGYEIHVVGRTRVFFKRVPANFPPFNTEEVFIEIIETSRPYDWLTTNNELSIVKIIIIT